MDDMSGRVPITVVAQGSQDGSVALAVNQVALLRKGDELSLGFATDGARA
jgi:hypothetical protein